MDQTGISGERSLAHLLYLRETRKKTNLSKATLTGEQLSDVFNDSDELDVRVSGLDHDYHNAEHIGTALGFLRKFLENINIELFSSRDNVEREKALLMEAMRRHDDDHAGHTYRQDKKYIDDYKLTTQDLAIYRFVRQVCGRYYDDKSFHGNISNEERASYLAVKDLFGKISTDDLIYIVRHILGTSFSQSDKELLVRNREQCYRPYNSETPSQKLIALADISGSIFLGLDVFIETSLNVWRESLDPIPENADVWITKAIGFLEFYAMPLLNALEHFFTKDYYQLLLKKVESLISELNDLDPGRKSHVEAQLKSIST